MKTDSATELDDYIARTERALFVNPPPTWEPYKQDPIFCWRYFARVFGHGLANYPEKEVLDRVKNLYGRWFVKIELRGKTMPKIESRDFTGWILEAAQEATAQIIANRTEEAIGGLASQFAGMTTAEIADYLRNLVENAGIVLDDDIETAAEALYEIANN